MGFKLKKVAPSPKEKVASKDIEAPKPAAKFASAVEWEQLSAANAVYIAGELKPARKPAKPAVKLLHVLEDFYDFYGLTEFHWSERNASYKATLIQQMQRYGDLDYQMSELKNIGSMKDVADYMVNYMETSISLSEARSLPLHSIFNSEYTNMTAARLVANVDANCMYTGLQCFRTSGEGPLNTSHWKPTVAERFRQPWCRGECKFYAATVWTAASNRSEARGRLSAVAADVPYLGNYAAFISLEFLTLNQLDRSSPQHVSLTALRTVSTGVTDLSTKDVQILLETTMLRTSFYTTKRDWGRFGLEVAFLVIVAISIRGEVNQWWLCILHVHYHGIDPSAKWWRGTVKYVTNMWNVIDVLSHVGTAGLAISYGVFIYVLLKLRERGAQTAWLDKNDADALLELSYNFKIWLYIALGHNTVIGLRMFQFLMAHGGLRIYYNMFIFGSMLIADFIIFFAYVFFVLGLAIAAFFQISGGNPAFTTSNDAIQSMALMTFGFLDYSTFYNGGWGATPDQQRLVQFLFWLTVILWIVVCQNLIIAIVLEAWRRAIEYQEQSLPTTASFLKITVLRLAFQGFCWLTTFLSIFHIRLSRIREDLTFKAFRNRRIRTFLTEVGIEVKDDPEWKAAEEVSKVFNRVSGFFARWAVCSMAEALVLLELFSDPALHRIYIHAVWLEEDFQSKVDSLYNNPTQAQGARAELLVDFDIHRPLSREELRSFLKLVGDTTLLKAKGLITGTRLFKWRDLKDLEDWIWKVYCRDAMDKDEQEVEGEDAEEEEEEGDGEVEVGVDGAEHGAREGGGRDQDSSGDGTITITSEERLAYEDVDIQDAARHLLKKTGHLGTGTLSRDGDEDPDDSSSPMRDGARSEPDTSPHRPIVRTRSEPGGLNLKVGHLPPGTHLPPVRTKRSGHGVQFGQGVRDDPRSLPGSIQKSRSGHASGYSSPSDYRTEAFNPMYDLLKKVAELDSIKTVHADPLAKRTQRRQQDIPGALSVPGGNMSKASGDSQTEGLLHVALLSQRELRQSLRRMETKLGTLVQMHQALLRNQQRLKEYIDEVGEMVERSKEQQAAEVFDEAETAPLRRGGEEVSFRSM